MLLKINPYKDTFQSKSSQLRNLKKNERIENIFLQQCFTVRQTDKLLRECSQNLYPE